MTKNIPRVSSVILMLALLAGCASTGFRSATSTSSNDWTLCSAKGGLALGIPVAAFDIATGGVAFIAGALFSGIACAAADNGMAVVQFELDSAALSKQQKGFLDTMAADLKPGMTIEVTGHTCDLGGMAYNQSLSETRAKAVQDYLMKKGVAKKNIKIMAEGESSPVVPNSSENNRSQNRRAEIRVTNS